MVEIVALPISLDDVGELRVGDVAHWCAGVRGDVLRGEPGGVGASEAVGGEGEEVRGGEAGG